MEHHKQLFLSNKNKKIFGLLGGLGEYFEIDPILIRVIWIVMTAFTGFVPGIVAYIIASLVVPKRKQKE